MSPTLKTPPPLARRCSEGDIKALYESGRRSATERASSFIGNLPRNESRDELITCPPDESRTIMKVTTSSHSCGKEDPALNPIKPDPSKQDDRSIEPSMGDKENRLSNVNVMPSTPQDNNMPTNRKEGLSVKSTKETIASVESQASKIEAPAASKAVRGVLEGSRISPISDEDRTATLGPELRSAQVIQTREKAKPFLDRMRRSALCKVVSSSTPRLSHSSKMNIQPGLSKAPPAPPVNASPPKLRYR